MTVAALYVQTNGCYFGLDGVDPWDEARDARKYAGPWPVVAHPPCARWCKLAGHVEKRRPERKRGEDGGCFAAALAAVRTYGGVLEHPAYTAAWAAFGLPRPPFGGWHRTMCGGWVVRVDQVHYGHRASKPTWLYANTLGACLPTIKTGYVAPSVVGTTKRTGGVAMLSKRERSATPGAFRDLLLGIARHAASLHQVDSTHPHKESSL